MHKNYRKADDLSRRVIGAAIAVHRELGPGLLEDIYEHCLDHEMRLLGIDCECQMETPVKYKGKQLDYRLRLDMLIEGCLVVELKAVESVLPIHKAQALTYMKLVDAPVGLVINFNTVLLKDGVSRLYLPGANAE